MLFVSILKKKHGLLKLLNLNEAYIPGHLFLCKYFKCARRYFAQQWKFIRSCAEHSIEHISYSFHVFSSPSLFSDFYNETKLKCYILSSRCKFQDIWTCVTAALVKQQIFLVPSTVLWTCHPSWTTIMAILVTCSVTCPVIKWWWNCTDIISMFHMFFIMPSLLLVTL